MGAISVTSPLAMQENQEITKDEIQNNQFDTIENNNQDDQFLNLGENFFDLLPNETLVKIVQKLDAKGIARLRSTNKDWKNWIDDEAKRLFDNGYDDKTHSVKNVGALLKSAEMGHKEAQKILQQKADEIYKKLENAINKDIKLTLCKDLAETGLFLLLDREEQKAFIEDLYYLAKDNQEGALEVFQNLESQKEFMKEGVLEHYENKLNKLNNHQENLNN